MSTIPATDQPPGFDTGTPPPRPPWWRRKLVVIPAAGLALILAAAIGAAARDGGSSTPALVHVHGTLAQGLGSNCQVSGGDQVTITGPDGKVLAAPNLAMSPITKNYNVSGVTVPERAYPFSAAVQPQPRYGITAEGNPPYYVTQQQFEKGIDLSC